MTTLKIEKKRENKQNDNNDNRRRKKYHQQVKKINWNSEWEINKQKKFWHKWRECVEKWNCQKNNKKYIQSFKKNVKLNKEIIKYKN